MKNKITDLRNHLFETLEGLLDKQEPLDIDRAKAVADVAQVIVNSAKIEVEFLKVMGSNVEDTGFIQPTKKLTN
jgi:hypothetical protein